MIKKGKAKKTTTLKQHRNLNIFWSIDILKEAVRNGRAICYLYNNKETRQLIRELQQFHLIYFYRVLEATNKVVVHLRLDLEGECEQLKRRSRPGLKRFKSYKSLVAPSSRSNPGTICIIRTKRGVKAYAPRIINNHTRSITAGGEMLFTLR